MIAGMSWLQIATIWGLSALVTGVGGIMKVGLRSALTYWLMGVLLGPISILFLLLDRRKKCPFCQHSVQLSARVCGECGHRLIYTHP